MIARTCVTLQIVGQQPVHRLDVVADRHDRKARTVERLRRVARRRGEAVAEQFGRDEEQRRRIERAVRADQPLVAVVVRHVVRRQQHHVVARGVEVAVRAVDDPRLRQRDAALGVEVVDDELVMLGGVRRGGRRLDEKHQRRDQMKQHAGILTPSPSIGAPRKVSRLTSVASRLAAEKLRWSSVHGLAMILRPLTSEQSGVGL